MRLAVLPFELGDGVFTREYADGLAATVIERVGELDAAGGSFAVIPASESLDLGESDPAKAASMLGANLVAHTRLVRDGEQLRAELGVWNADAARDVATRRVDISRNDPIAARETMAATLV
ncbi:MAG: hypothetical protein WD733_08485 [Bryobacterales bacterium]